MTGLLRWVVAVVALGHGLVHLVFAAERLGWIDDPSLRESDRLGGLWLTAGLLLLLTAALAAADVRAWWLVTIVAAIASQVAIVTAWGDAGTGTLANVVLLVVAVYALLALGRRSLRGQWTARSDEALAAAPADGALVTEDDLARLPAPVAAYVRQSGAVGEPRPRSIRAEFHGRIRADRGEPWMPFTGRQVTTFGADPRRYFLMDATRSGLPVTVLHCYARGVATMRAKVLSTVTVLDSAGPELNRGETVTVLDDLVLLAPGALVDAPIEWTVLDEHRVRAEFTNGGHTVSAELAFDETGRLLDFVSQDRMRASSDGSSFEAQDWSTPEPRRRQRDGVHVLRGSARWRVPEGWFTYVELDFDRIETDPGAVRRHGSPASERSRTRPGVAPGGRRVDRGHGPG